MIRYKKDNPFLIANCLSSWLWEYISENLEIVDECEDKFSE